MGLNGSLIVLALLAVAGVSRSGLVPNNFWKKNYSHFIQEDLARMTDYPLIRSSKRQATDYPPAAIRSSKRQATDYAPAALRTKRQATGLSFGAHRCRLYCQNGFYLQTNQDGTVNGTKESASKFGESHHFAFIHFHIDHNASPMKSRFRSSPRAN